MKKCLALMLSCMTLTSCNDEINDTSEVPKDVYFDVTKANFTYEKHKSPNDWKCVDIANDRLCHPADWLDERKENTIFIAKIPHHHYSFFVILRYGIKKNGLTTMSHLKHVYGNMTKTPPKEVLSSKAFESLYQEQSVIRGDYKILHEGSEYYVMTMYTSIDSVLYDFTLQVPYSQKEQMTEQFETIIYNYKRNGKYIIRPTQIEKMKIIDIAKIGGA